MGKPITKEELERVVKMWEEAGCPSPSRFAVQIQRSERTVRAWLNSLAPTMGIKMPVKPTETLALHSDDILRDKVASLSAQLTNVRRETLDEHYVKEKIIGLTEAALNTAPPAWLITPKKTKSLPGVPTLFASDWHWGEVVQKTQVAGLNEYDMAIANRRAKALVTNAIDVLNNHMVNPKYPGIVFALGGDMVSGGIHEELLATDEMEIMPVVLDAIGVLTWCIKTLANEFGNVFVPCVSGNHGRNTKKIRHKGRNFTNYDWLIYQFLSKIFEEDARVKFLIPDGPECTYAVYGHKYLLTHGDQARGGDGVIGMLGPVIRLDHRKRSRASQLDRSYDTMLIGHFHQLTQLRRLIINGSLKGYCEYAFANNFGYEPPQQGLWLTHPTRGITFSMPVHVEAATAKGVEWISWSK